MAQSKLPLIVSVLSLLVAVLSIWALFSTWNSGTSGGSRLSAATYTDDEAPEPPIAIDPGQIDYAETNRIAIDSRSVSALAVDADDKIYVAGDKAVFRFSPQGRLELRIPLSLEPTCLTVGNRQHMVPGRIYVGFVDHVEVFDANGLETAIWQGLGERARITSISSSEHYIFIADAGQNVVQRFDWEGKLLESFGESNPAHFSLPINGVATPFDLVVGLDDLIYCVNRRSHRIEGYSYDGNLERHWGNASPAVEDFSGLNNPAHLTITPNDEFVTAEEYPLRVKVYSRSGKCEHVVCGAEGTGPVVALAGDHHEHILVLDGKARCVRVFAAKKPPAAQSVM